MMLHHIGMYVENLERSVAFYEKIVTIQSMEKLNWNDTKLLFIKGEGFQLELIQDAHEVTKGAHIAFTVMSIEEKIRELQYQGLSPSEGPYQVENGWKTVFYEGPDGEEIEFIELG
ncbi:VOC family protein [Fictibacillus barbaricus]|uniref:Lactoylglutathione lyase n=1 Tax=Fictibacillus barbaricus TaxID=182136 RepID=A0ABU1U641_9BACL|nr:VOC family protein [Fictibacillus barbaricus]MDR7074921.1 lactoylglutathione lyase [Fictibacillus barbaricus]